MSVDKSQLKRQAKADLVHDALHELSCSDIEVPTKQVHSKAEANLAHNCGSMLAHKLIWELEAGEDLGEDLGLHHHLRHVHAVLGNLGQGTADLPLQLRLLIQHEGSQIGHSTCTTVKDCK